MSRKAGRGSGGGMSAAKMRSAQDRHYSRGGGGGRSARTPKPKAVKYTDKIPF